MTFENGTDTHTASQPEITESLIKLLAVVFLSVGIVGAFLLMIIDHNLEGAQLIQPIVFGIIAFWFGSSAVSTWAGVQQQKIKAGIK